MTRDARSEIGSQSELSPRLKLSPSVAVWIRRVDRHTRALIFQALEKVANDYDNGISHAPYENPLFTEFPFLQSLQDQRRASVWGFQVVYAQDSLGVLLIDSIDFDPPPRGGPAGTVAARCVIPFEFILYKAFFMRRSLRRWSFDRIILRYIISRSSVISFIRSNRIAGFSYFNEKTIDRQILPRVSGSIGGRMQGDSMWRSLYRSAFAYLFNREDFHLSPYARRIVMCIGVASLMFQLALKAVTEIFVAVVQSGKNCRNTLSKVPGSSHAEKFMHEMELVDRKPGCHNDDAIYLSRSVLRTFVRPVDAPDAVVDAGKATALVGRMIKAINAWRPLFDITPCGRMNVRHSVAMAMTT